MWWSTLLQITGGAETQEVSLSTLFLAFMIKEKRWTWRKIRAGSTERATSHSDVSTVEVFWLCQALVFVSSWEEGLGMLPPGCNGKSHPVLSHVFPWQQWGHVVYLTAGLRTEVWWLTEWCYLSRVRSLGGSVEPERRRREEPRGGLKSGFRHTAPERVHTQTHTHKHTHTNTHTHTHRATNLLYIFTHTHTHTHTGMYGEETPSYR